MFLAEINAVTPSAAVVECISPHYPTSNFGRPPSGVERVLRLYIVQQCVGLADEAMEGPIDDSQGAHQVARAG